MFCWKWQILNCSSIETWNIRKHEAVLNEYSCFEWYTYSRSSQRSQLWILLLGFNVLRLPQLLLEWTLDAYIICLWYANTLIDIIQNAITVYSQRPSLMRVLRIMNRPVHSSCYFWIDSTNSRVWALQLRLDYMHWFQFTCGESDITSMCVVGQGILTSYFNMSVLGMPHQAMTQACLHLRHSSSMCPSVDGPCLPALG